MTSTNPFTKWLFKAASRQPFHRPQIQSPDWLPGKIPGHVHCDLVDNRIIADPFTERHEIGCSWVDETDWTYRCEFEFQANKELPTRVLRFEGLDTVCDIFLNDDLIGAHDNMFMPLELDVTGLLRNGTNELRVEFKSAVNTGIQRRKQFFEEQGLLWDTAWFDERAFIRKAGYMSGWDWGPRLVSCGIWKPVQLLQYQSRIKSFHVLREPLANNAFRLRTEAVVEGDAQLQVQFGSEVSNADLDIVVENPDLWWPNGYGTPTLYDVSAGLDSGDRVVKRVGFRTIELSREQDNQGESFDFVVNGTKIWARGANWIPNDSFPSRVTDRDYKRQVETCQELNMNMLRVWGGGLYESEAFYDACDENGILVWQDFPYACSYYPDDDDACAAAEKEARYQVDRLKDRTSLALWCGNNENLVMWESKWGGQEKSPTRFFGERIYNEVLPKALADFDSKTPYVISSPSSAAIQTPTTPQANGGDFGDQHYWDVWHGRGDWKYYADSTARFASEFGFAGSCSLSQWDQVISRPSEWQFDSPTVRWHDKTGKPFEAYSGYVTAHYPEPKTLEDWVYRSQLNQRDALRFGIEHYRRGNTCSGALIWQFNDCWPVESWAVQDGLRRLKPAGFELKRLFAPITLALSNEGSVVSGTLIADSPKNADYKVEMVAYSTITGRVTKSQTLTLSAGGESRVVNFQWDRTDLPAVETLIRAQIQGIPGSETWRLLAEPKEMKVKKPALTVRWHEGLVVDVKGVAIDLVLRDPDDLQNVIQSHPLLPGAAPLTAVDETLRVPFLRRPKRVIAQSLAGELTLALHSENGVLVEEHGGAVALVQEPLE